MAAGMFKHTHNRPLPARSSGATYVVPNFAPARTSRTQADRLLAFKTRWNAHKNVTVYWGKLFKNYTKPDPLAILASWIFAIYSSVARCMKRLTACTC